MFVGQVPATGIAKLTSRLWGAGRGSSASTTEDAAGPVIIAVVIGCLT